MQEGKLKLKEIIWEVTGQCKNKCTYCGSKGVWNRKVDSETICKIVDAIAEYPPEELDISGGDPLLVSKEDHTYIYNKLSDKIKLKILVNPKSFIFRNPEEINSILDLYEIVGLSINSVEDINLYESKIKGCGFDSIYKPNKVTVITNFNFKNIFDFNTIRDFVKEKDCSWMVQFTVYKDEDSLALYNNENAINDFFEKIQIAIDMGVKILISDNVNNAPCGAGTRSLGILYDGTVVPCLSMRSWVKEIGSVRQGNILIEDLQDIWKTNFCNYRYGTFKSCKDVCSNRVFKYKKQSRVSTLPPEENLPKYNYQEGVMVYSVQPYIPLSPGEHPSTMMYAVRTYGNTSDLKG